MEILNSISPLPFYASESAQNHRRSYPEGQVWPVIMEYGRILPFQFIVGTDRSYFSNDFNNDFYKDIMPTSVPIRRAYAHPLNNPSAKIDILSDLNAGGLSTHVLDKTRVLVKYTDTAPLQRSLPEGLYYISLHISASSSFIVYSEVFVVCKNVQNHLKLEYKNSYNMDTSKGPIDFSGDFVFKCYLDTALSKPEYTFEEEATSRMGYTFIETQVSKKTYKFSCIGPEFLCDALRLVRLCDYKRITGPRGLYEPMAFSMSVEWEDQGDLATIDCEFEVDNIIHNIGNLT